MIWGVTSLARFLGLVVTCSRSFEDWRKVGVSVESLVQEIMTIRDTRGGGGTFGKFVGEAGNRRIGVRGGKVNET